MAVAFFRPDSPYTVTLCCCLGIHFPEHSNIQRHDLRTPAAPEAYFNDFASTSMIEEHERPRKHVEIARTRCERPLKPISRHTHLTSLLIQREVTNTMTLQGDHQRRSRSSTLLDCEGIRIVVESFVSCF